MRNLFTMRLSIPKPCHENWNEMTPVEQGAFCNACAKVVVDFSTMSDAEVIHYFEQKQEGKTCGRFRASQLSPYQFKVNWRSIASQKSFPKIFAAAVFIFFSSLFICKSDTGDLMSLKVIAADTKDSTAAVVQLIPLVYAIDAITIDTSAYELTVEGDVDVVREQPQEIDLGEEIVVGVMVMPEPVTAPIDTPTITGDTIPFDLRLGDVVTYIEPTIKGKVACTIPVKEKKFQSLESKRIRR